MRKCFVTDVALESYLPVIDSDNLYCPPEMALSPLFWHPHASSLFKFNRNVPNLGM